MNEFSEALRRPHSVRVEKRRRPIPLKRAIRLLATCCVLSCLACAGYFYFLQQGPDVQLEEQQRTVAVRPEWVLFVMGRPRNDPKFNQADVDFAIRKLRDRDFHMSDRDRAQALAVAGGMRIGSGNMREAHELYTLAVEYEKKAGMPVRSYGELAEEYMREGNYERGIEILRQALAWDESHGFQRQEMSLYTRRRLALAYEQMGRYDKVLDCYRQIAALAGDSLPDYQTCGILGQADTLVSLNRWKESSQLVHNWMDQSSDYAHRVLFDAWSKSIAARADYPEDPVKRLEGLKKAAESAAIALASRQIQDRPLVLRMLLMTQIQAENGVALCYAQLGDKKQAHSWLEHAIQLAAQTGHTREAVKMRETGLK